MDLCKELDANVAAEPFGATSGATGPVAGTPARSAPKGKR